MAFRNGVTLMSNIVRIFLCCPQEGMEKERDVVRHAMDHLDAKCISMETFGAWDNRAIRTCRHKVEQCELVIVIVGNSYGSICENTGLSFSELEYDKAREADIPVYPYFKANTSAPSDGLEPDKHREKLEQFKYKLSRHTHAPYNDLVELAIKVTADVSRFLRSREERETGGEPDIGPERISDEHPKSAPSAVFFRAYGEVWNDVSDAVMDMGLAPVIADTTADLGRALGEAKIVIIPGSGHAKDTDVPGTEVDLLRDFVRRGGGLLCVGQAWSWACRGYGNMPVELFPLNQIGRPLGFRITGRNIGNPDMRTLHNVLRGTVRAISSENWWPSEIETTTADREVLIRDENGRAMAVRLSHGTGKVIAAGHEAMLKLNPELLRAFLRLLTETD